MGAAGRSAAAAGWLAAEEGTGAAASAGAAAVGLGAGAGVATAGLAAEAGGIVAAGLSITGTAVGADAACIGFGGAAGAGAGFATDDAAGCPVVLVWAGEVGLPGACSGPFAGGAEGRTDGAAADGGSAAGWLSADFGAAVTGGTGAGAGFAAAGGADGVPAVARGPAPAGLAFVEGAAAGALLPCIDCDEAAAGAFSAAPFSAAPLPWTGAAETSLEERLAVPLVRVALCPARPPAAFFLLALIGSFLT